MKYLKKVLLSVLFLNCIICLHNCYGAIDLFDFRMGVGEIFYTGNFNDYLPLNTAGVELGLDLYTKKYLIDLGYGGNFSPYRLKQPFVFWDTGTSIGITNYFIKLGYLVNREELSENKLNCYPYAGISKNMRNPVKPAGQSG